MRAYGAEALGTALLVIGGCSAAIFAAQSLGLLGIGIAFGLSLMLVAYIFGPISGGHVNPAVTLGLALSGKFPWRLVPGYMVAQIIGGLLGGGILYAVASSIERFDIVRSGFGANTLNDGVSLTAAILMEVLMATIFVLAVLGTTRKGFPTASVPVTIGAALTLVHIISIPFTNTSVNPARSLAVAYYVPETWQHLWIFLVSPLIGAAIAFLIYRFVIAEKSEQETPAEPAQEASQEVAPESEIEEEGEITKDAHLDDTQKETHGRNHRHS